MEFRFLTLEDVLELHDMQLESYGGATCCGTFTHGHVGANCLDELFRVLKPGAPFAFTVKLEVFESMGFKGKLAALMQSGRIKEQEVDAPPDI